MRRGVFERRTYPYPTRCPSTNNKKCLRFHRVCFHVKPNLDRLQRNADRNMHKKILPTVLLFSAVTTSGVIIATPPETLDMFKQEYKSQYYHKLLDRMFLKDSPDEIYDSIKLKMEDSLFKNIFRNECKKIKFIIDPTARFAHSLFKQNCERFISVKSREEIDRFANAIEYDMKWQILCCVQRFSSGFWRFWERTVYSKIDKTNQVNIRPQSDMIEMSPLRLFLRACLKYEKVSNAKASIDKKENTSYSNRQVIVFNSSVLRTYEDIIVLCEQLESTNNSCLCVVGKHPFVSFQGDIQILTEGNIHKHMRFIYCNIPSIRKKVPLYAPYARGENGDTIHFEDAKLQDLISFSELFDCSRSDENKRFFSGTYEDVPLWNLYLAACDLEPSLQVQQVKDLLAPSSILYNHESISCGNLFAKSLYVSETTVGNLFHGHSEYLKEYLDLGVIEWHAWISNGKEDDGVEGNGLDEGNAATTDIDGRQEVIFTCRDIVVPISSEHSSTISGNFTVSPLHALYFTNHIHSDIEVGEKRAKEKRQWMNDRALILECDMDLHEMKREHTNLCEREMNLITEWKDAKAEYNKGEKNGGLSKQEFRRLLIHLYAKDEDLSIARSVVDARIEELMNTKRCATERLKKHRCQSLDTGK